MPIQSKVIVETIDWKIDLTTSGLFIDEQNRTEQNKTKQNKTKQNRTEQNRTEQNTREQNR
jgi:hypothetical protein